LKHERSAGGKAEADDGQGHVARHRTGIQLSDILSELQWPRHACKSRVAVATNDQGFSIMKSDLNRIIAMLEDVKTSLEEIRGDSEDERLKDLENILGQIIDELEAPNEGKSD
jgi:hypothetical protein